MLTKCRSNKKMEILSQTQNEVRGKEGRQLKLGKPNGKKYGWLAVFCPMLLLCTWCCCCALGVAAVPDRLQSRTQPTGHLKSATPA